jgi:pseudouridine-5'-phosphate glycosidase
VLGYGTDVFPQFLSRGQASLRTPATAADINAAADLCRAGWMALGRSQGVLIAQPPPAEHAIGQEEMDQAVESALAAADAKGIVGPARTPFLLAHVANRTGGRSVEANIALLLANARLAASLAAEIAAFDAAR